MQPLSLTSPSSSPMLGMTPSSPSLSTTPWPSPPADLYSALQLAQTRARQKEKQLDALHQLVHLAIASTFSPLPPTTSPALRAERRVERKAVARAVMPMVFKTDLFRRWKAEGRSGSGRGMEVEGDAERLMREVIDEEAVLHSWTVDERKDMLHFMCDALAQQQSHSAEASTAPSQPPVSLVEAMEGSMVLYHALLGATQRLAALEGAVKASSVLSSPLVATSSSPAMASTHAGSSSSLSSVASSSFSSSPASSPSVGFTFLPSSMSTEMAFFLQQHARDEAEKAELRQQVRQLQLQLAAAPAPRLLPTAASLSSAFASLGSLLALGHLLYMSATFVAWNARRAYSHLNREVKKKDGWEGVVKDAVSGVMGVYQQMVDFFLSWL